MIKKLGIVFLIFCLLLTPFLGGCWDKRELQNIGVVHSFGLDLIPEEERQNDEGILVTVEIVDVLTGTGLEGSKIFSASGQTVLDAMRNLSNKMERQLFVGICKELVLGKSIVDDGANKYIDYFYRDENIDNNIYINVAQGAAKYLMNGQSGITSFSSIGRMDMLDHQKQNSTGKINSITLSKYVQRILKDKQAVILPMAGLFPAEDTQQTQDPSKQGGGAQIKGNKQSAQGSGASQREGEKSQAKQNVYFIGMAVLDDNGRFVDTLMDHDEQLGTLIWQGKSVDFILPIDTGENGSKLGLEIIRFNLSKKWRQTEQGLKLEAELHVTGNFMEELGPSSSYATIKDNVKLNEICSKTLENILQKSWQKALQLEQDYLLAGDSMYKYKNKLWQSVKNDWPAAMRDVELEITVKSKISFLSNYNNSIWKIDLTNHPYK